jgi:hypothetical protein
MNEFVFFEKNQRFLLNFGALSPNLFLGQVPEIILRNTEIALFEWLGKRPQGILLNQSKRGFFGFSIVFKTVFGMFLAHLVCLKSDK